MIFRTLATICLCLTTAPARADFESNQSSYARIAAKCGADPSKPSFSDADYAAALSDAAKEETKFSIPPIATCWAFKSYYTAFSARAATLIKAGKITKADRNRIREAFRKPA